MTRSPARPRSTLAPLTQAPLLAALLIHTGPFRHPAAAAAEVTVRYEPRQTMTYGMDFERLWYWDSLVPEEKQRLARLAVQECRVDYVRVAINVGAEKEEGQIDWEDAYRQIFDCMRTLRDARPDIRFFAIPRPIHVAIPGAPYTCFPLWVTVFDENQRFQTFHWDKAADLLVRHLRTITGHGFKITYMDVKNECDKKIRPDEAARMIERMREQLRDEMPVVVAPSSHNYKAAVNWLQEAIKKGVTNFFDIASTHNCKETGSIEAVVRIAREMGKPVWNTELHNWNGPDELVVTNTRVLFGQIRAGVSGINEWLSLGNEIKVHKMFRAVNGQVEVMRRYYTFKQLVNTSGGGQYLDANIPEGLTSVVAFIRKPLMTVWLLNAGPTPVESIRVTLEGRRMVGETIERVWWDPGNGREGTTDRFRPETASSFTVSAPADSLTCLAFDVEDSPPRSDPPAGPAAGH